MSSETPPTAASQAGVLRRAWLDVAATAAPQLTELPALLDQRLTDLESAGSLDEPSLLAVAEEGSQYALEQGAGEVARALSKRLRRAIYEFLLALDAVNPAELANAPALTPPPGLEPRTPVAFTPADVPGGDEPVAAPPAPTVPLWEAVAPPPTVREVYQVANRGAAPVVETPAEAVVDVPVVDEMGAEPEAATVEFADAESGADVAEAQAAEADAHAAEVADAVAVAESVETEPVAAESGAVPEAESHLRVDEWLTVAEADADRPVDALASDHWDAPQADATLAVGDAEWSTAQPGTEDIDAAGDGLGVAETREASELADTAEFEPEFAATATEWQAAEAAVAAANEPAAAHDTAQPAAEPVAGVAETHDSEAHTEPLAEAADSHGAEGHTEPVADATAAPDSDTDIEPVAEAPATEAHTEPVTQAPTPPHTEALPEPVAVATDAPDTAAHTEPVAEAPAPDTEALPEPVAVATDAPATEAHTEPVAEAPAVPDTEVHAETDAPTSSEPWQAPIVELPAAPEPPAPASAPEAPAWQPAAEAPQLHVLPGTDAQPAPAPANGARPPRELLRVPRQFRRLPPLASGHSNGAPATPPAVQPLDLPPVAEQPPAAETDDDALGVPSVPWVLAQPPAVEAPPEPEVAPEPDDDMGVPFNPFAFQPDEELPRPPALVEEPLHPAPGSPAAEPLFIQPLPGNDAPTLWTPGPVPPPSYALPQAAQPEPFPIAPREGFHLTDPGSVIDPTAFTAAPPAAAPEPPAAPSAPAAEVHPDHDTDDGVWRVRQSPRAQLLAERMAQKRREEAARAAFEAASFHDEDHGRRSKRRGHDEPTPDLPTARRQLDEHLRKKRGAEAGALLQRLAQELGGREIADLALDAGDRCRALGQSRSATNCYLAAWRADPLYETPLWRLSDICLNDQEIDLAVGYLERIAELMRSRGDDEGAIGVYRKIAMIAPERQDVRDVIRLAKTTGRLDG